MMLLFKYRFLRLSLSLVIIMQLIFSTIVSAQEMQAVPIMPQLIPQQSPANIIPPVRVSQPPPLSTPAAIQPRLPVVERTSEFEEYISNETLEVNEFQLDIVKRFEGITFQYSSKNIPKDKIAIAVKVTRLSQLIQSEQQDILKKTEEKTPVKESGFMFTPQIIDAGYLVGSRETLSEVFNMLGIKNPFAVSTSLKQFGYDLFRQPPSTFAPVENVPVGHDYVIGPGDELRIAIWGKVEGQWTVAVDRDGNINIPKLGILGVTGLTFRELKDVIHKEFSKYFTGFEMNISMGSLKTIRVYVVGNAERPGAYTVSSLSTLINALFEAGGPSKTGTMRDIQVKRNGATVVSFDMYDFLLRGDKTKDVRLMSEDVIFIPPVGHLAAIAGSVKNPAIYELKNETTISKLIDMAGGLSTVAFTGRIQIERIIDNQRQIVFESDYTPVKDAQMVLKSGDILKIFQIVQDRHTVKISGAVHREGEYGFTAGMSLKDLVSMSGGLKYYAYNQNAELTRINITNDGPKTEKIILNLEKALNGDADNNISLQKNDYLFVRSIPEWKLYETVSIQGEVKFPGTYAIKKSEQLSSLIERAGGYTDNAHLRGALFTRERVRELQQLSIEEMIKRLERDLFAEGSLQVSTALSREEIEAKKVEIAQKQKFIEELKTVKATGRLTIRLAHIRLLKGSEYDIELEEGDSLVIPTKNAVVNVAGSVMSPGSFVYSPRLDYKDYIKMAGSYSKYADTGNVYVLKVDGSARQLSSGLLGWNPFKSRWEMAAFGEDIKEIEPGDSIVVPDKLERVAWLRDIKDLTQILMQMAVTAGVILRLY